MAKWHGEQLDEAVRTWSGLYPPASECGITRVYTCRANATEDVLRDIRAILADKTSDKHTLWMLGVSLSKDFALKDLQDDLRQIVDAGKTDLKILLLDPYRSPGILRTILESSRKEVKYILDFDREKRRDFGNDPLIRQPLFAEWDGACRRLEQAGKFELNTRIYGHYPTCWLIIVDDVAYFEPYTFGRGPERQEGESIGSDMPVLKFQRQPGGKPFHILLDHFDKLWLTSDLDLFHLKARRGDHPEILRKIFKVRLAWLNKVYDALYAAPVRGRLRDQRICPRQQCKTELPDLAMAWGTRSSQAEIVDSSRGGLALRVPPDSTAPEGTVVQVTGMLRTDTPGATAMAEHFSAQCDNTFIVRAVTAHGVCKGQTEPVRLTSQEKVEESRKNGSLFYIEHLEVQRKAG